MPYPNLPVSVSRILVLRALQAKPMYEGGALPKDPKRRAKRLKVKARDARRSFVTATV